MPLVERPDVGSQIRKARIAAGLTQVEMARRLDVAERTYQSWEGNGRTPRIDALTSLAALVGLPVGFFYSDDNVAADHAAAAVPEAPAA